MTFVLTEESELAQARKNTVTTPKILLELQKPSTDWSNISQLKLILLQKN